MTKNVGLDQVEELLDLYREELSNENLLLLVKERQVEESEAESEEVETLHTPAVLNLGAVTPMGVIWGYFRGHEGVINNISNTH